NSLTDLEYHLEEVYKSTTDQLDRVNPEGQQYPHNEPINYDKHALWGVSHWGRKRQQFYGFAVNRESALDVYSKRRIIAVTELKIVELHNYKHLDWISVRRDDDKIYRFKEGDFKMLRIQNIEDMLLLLVQGKLSNMTVEERFSFNVSLRMFTRSIVIQRRVKDLQLGVESYQKRLNLTKPDMYRSDLKRREAYTAHSNLRGFIYQNKDKKNRLIRIDKLHKFSDETLNDVCNALDDREISSGSTTTHSDISLLDYEAFYFDDDHIKEISSGNTTTHSNTSLSEYDSFIFEEFVDELAHIISSPKYDRFYFWNLPDPGELMSVLNSGIRENFSTTLVNLPIEDDYSPLLAYVLWIFVVYLTYPIIPPYLHPFEKEDTIFDPGITINHFYSFKHGLSHRHGAFKKFNTHRSHLNEWPMIINGKNTPILDVLLFHFYPLDQIKYGGNWVKLSDLKQALRGRHPMLISSLIFPFSS
nr:hypothetical protein [Tanacetum cinerariifolium]